MSFFGARFHQLSGRHDMKGRPSKCNFTQSTEQITIWWKFNSPAPRPVGAFDTKIRYWPFFEIIRFWFKIYVLSCGRFLIKRIYSKFLPNSDINGPVNRQFSQASRRKPFGPLFYLQTFRSFNAVVDGNKLTSWYIIFTTF